MRSLIRDYFRDRRGSTAMIFALSAIPILGAIGGGIDFARAKAASVNLQSALDGAVLAGAAVTTGQSTVATNYFNSNLALHGATLTNSAFTPNNDGTVSGTATITVPTSLLGVVGMETIQITDHAVAAKAVMPSPACLIALDSSASPNVSGIIGAGAGALNASGSGTIKANSCNIYVNSSSAHSIDVTGGGTINGDYVSTAGDVSGNVTAVKSLTKHAAATADPYQTTRSIPSWSGCSNSVSWSGSIANPTGVLAFCSAVTVSGNTTLAPGVYIILNGGLTSTKNISGTGVTIILTSTTPSTDNGVFDFKSGANVTLSAPTTGSTAGIALWADTQLPHNADNFRAGSTANIQGAIYLPSHLVNFSGSAQTGTNCTQLIAAQIAISGGADFYHNCSAAGTLDPGVGSYLRLVS